MLDARRGLLSAGVELAAQVHHSFRCYFEVLAHSITVDILELAFVLLVKRDLSIEKDSAKVDYLWHIRDF